MNMETTMPVIADPKQTDLEEFTGKAVQSKKPAPNTITVQNKVLAPAMARAVSVLGRVNGVPILNCVLIRIVSNVMSIDATDMELSIQQDIPCEGADRVLCIDGTTLGAVVRGLPSDGEITLEVKTETVVLRCGGARVTLAAHPVDEYPRLSGGEFVATFEVPTADLAYALAHTRPLTDTNVTRLYLSGLHFSIYQEKIRVVGASAPHMGVIRLTMPDGAAEMPEFILPPHSVDEIAKILDGGSVHMSVAHNRVSFAVPGITVTTKLIDAAFPDIEPLLRRATSNVWTVDRPELLKAINLASTVVTKEKTVIISVELSSEELTISARKERDESIITMPTWSYEYTGSPVSMAFRADVLVTMVKMVEKNMEFSFGDPEWFLMRDPDNASGSYICGSYRAPGASS